LNSSFNAPCLNHNDRHKDRNSDSSQLSPVEALRFTRAMYRIMLFADVFPGKCTIYIDDEDTEQEAEIRAARKDFFAMFPTQELYEIHTVDNFIESLGTWLVRKVKNKPWGVCPSFNMPTILEDSNSPLPTCERSPTCGVSGGVP
jgi:hypothetical protein